MEMIDAETWCERCHAYCSAPFIFQYQMYNSANLSNLEKSTAYCIFFLHSNTIGTTICVRLPLHSTMPYQSSDTHI